MTFYCSHVAMAARDWTYVCTCTARRGTSRDGRARGKVFGHFDPRAMTVPRIYYPLFSPFAPSLLSPLPCSSLCISSTPREIVEIAVCGAITRMQSKRLSAWSTLSSHAHKVSRIIIRMRYHSDGRENAVHKNSLRFET